MGENTSTEVGTGFLFPVALRAFRKGTFSCYRWFNLPTCFIPKIWKVKAWMAGGRSFLTPPPPSVSPYPIPPTAEWSKNVWRVVLYLPQIPHPLSLCFDICTVFHSRWSLLLAINAKVQKKGERPPTVCISNLFGMWWRNDWHLFDYSEKWLESLLTLL